MSPSKIFEKSIIISAHPDDEILWFSSILKEVDEVVVCFLPSASNPILTTGRRKMLYEHPLKNISFFGLEEIDVRNATSFVNPVLTKFGIKIYNNPIVSKKYKNNYDLLIDKLTDKLKNCKNVFTHNPWGGYGNEEHIQVYKAVSEVQKKHNFNLWFTNYTSNKSFKLMTEYVFKRHYDYITLVIDKKLAEHIKSIYRKHECWTWYNDCKWFDEESFIKDDISNRRLERYSQVVPLNIIKIRFLQRSHRNIISLYKAVADLIKQYKNSK
ncbi:PIG-L family deacetylase [Candidatus Pacearchaeota archaeon]|nr:PIG-L family deacetylase [Candidatus Pacearchaeota archaeon]